MVENDLGTLEVDCHPFQLFNPNLLYVIFIVLGTCIMNSSRIRNIYHKDHINEGCVETFVIIVFVPHDY